MKQIVLDTETTGLAPEQGHRIIEIGCVELLNRQITGRHYHVYINPDRDVPEEAISVHGITNEFLVDKPRFAQIAEEFASFIDGAELIIHNAPFDIGFMDHEFALDGKRFGPINEICSVIDTLVMARERHPGQRNNLDALCKRYDVDNSQRDLHGALLDSEILADVYLAMTGGQTALALAGESKDSGSSGAAKISEIQRLSENRQPLPVISADSEEQDAHNEYMKLLAKKCGDGPIWGR
ncbi:MAG: DNA polymerase III subunit epsilon [Cellvibrionaceae bacterium]